MYIAATFIFLYDILIYFRHLPSNESFTASDDLKSVADRYINSNVDLGCSNNDNNSSN